jgi:hypothetical protein
MRVSARAFASKNRDSSSFCSFAPKVPAAKRSAREGCSTQACGMTGFGSIKPVIPSDRGPCLLSDECGERDLDSGRQRRALPREHVLSGIGLFIKPINLTIHQVSDSFLFDLLLLSEALIGWNRKVQYRV